MIARPQYCVAAERCFRKTAQRLPQEAGPWHMSAVAQPAALKRSESYDWSDSPERRD
jgi:hypothetical protein